MNPDHRLGHGFQVVRCQETDHISHARKRVRVAVRHAHAAAGNQVVAEQLVALGDDNEPEVVGENVDVIQRRNCEGRLEFARQIRLPIERVHEILVAGVIQVEFLAFNPDFVIRACGRVKRGGQGTGLFQHVVHQRTRGRCRRRHDVAFHVPARGNRRDQRLVQPLDGLAQARFDAAVKLKVLARRYPERVVGVLGSQRVAGQILSSAQNAPGELRAHHENPLLGDLALVAVVLLVNPMKLQEFIVVLREVVHFRIVQRLSNRPCQRSMSALKVLIARQLRCRRF